MKKIFLLLVIIATTACFNRKREAHENIESDGVDTVLSVQYISPVLGAKIDELIEYRNRNTVRKYKEIYSVITSQENESDYIYLYGALHYREKWIVGYGYHENHTIAFYGYSSENIDKHIYKDVLIPYVDTIPGYLSLEKDESMVFDPVGFKLKIVSQDSLEIVYKGMF